MNQGDIVLLAFPFTDLSSSKVRPALLVSSDTFNAANADMLFLCITSNTDHIQAEDTVVDASHPEFPNTGLKAASTIRAGRAHTLSKKLVRRRLGRAGPRLLQEAISKLQGILALP